MTESAEKNFPAYSHLPYENRAAFDSLSLYVNFISSHNLTILDRSNVTSVR